ncbi:MAG: glycosyltransferase [Coriobacteriales bacterium]|nr:glycosyltransferase [Coriobacteriales bacterium]
MRVLHIVTLVDDRNSYGGPLTVAINQCQELRRRGHDAVIAAGWRGEGDVPTEIEGVPAHLFPVTPILPRTRFAGLYSFGLARWLRNNSQSIDIAHVHFARDLVPLSAARTLYQARIPYVTQTHGMVVPDARLAARLLDRFAAAPVLRRAACRFVLTPAEQQALLAVCGPQSQTEHLPNGIRIRETTQLKPVPPVLDVLFMARLHPRKRVMEFAQAAEQVGAGRTDVAFSIVGPDDGDLPQLRDFIASRPHLDKALIYEGSLTHESALHRLARADIYVLPSVDEPFPMSILEALGAGVPAICTDSCGIAEPLSRSKAVAVTSGQPGALAKTLENLISDTAQRTALRIAGLEAIHSEYSIEAVVDQLEQHYRKFTDGD